jgi:Transmembrane Fragile-X-F protein
MSDTDSNSGGLGLAGATFIVFLTLKLTHVIDWSWWWVTSPLWIPTSLVLVLAGVAGLVIGANKALDAHEDKKRQDKREADRQARLKRL